MKKVELLAPAGSFDALRAAVSNGADAVYLGGKNFSARAYAANFDDEEMKEAVRYAHLRNVKIYVTVNTLLNEDELKAALDTCEKYYEYGVDALIIQDLGLYYALKQRHPDFDLHASTQMHIHNIEGIRTVKKLGFARTVVARESSLDFLKEACRQGIEIECFVHGAICVSYSGQCLLSSVTKSRSANRGMCAQCCRLRYDLLEDGRKIPTDTAYLLSPKDMYLLEDIPKLIEAGISSFKIEGRMKSPAYVAYVTRMYRKAIDAYYNKQQFTITEQERDELKVLFNRGFTDTYLKRSGEDLFGQERPNHLGIPIGEVVGRKGKQLLIRLSGTLRQFDGIRVVHGNNEEGMILNRLYRKENLISDAGKGETVAIDLKGDFRKGDPVYKTVDSALQKKLEDLPEKKIPVDLDITLYPDQEPVIIAYVDGHEYTYIHPEKPSAAMSHPLDEENIREPSQVMWSEFGFFCY
ncbi:MAG: U32 family peptidase [Erysipelotrichaceae bacterium]|nr:U32 family peptidase [Erysipelotrichaceae bacterium]